MPRKSRRQNVPRPDSMVGSARVSRGDLPRAAPSGSSPYRHVRGDLIRVALLAFILFGALILLRVLAPTLGLLP